MERPVPVNRSDLASGLLLALLTAILCFAPSDRTYAQTTTRSFQMALWQCCGPTPTSTDTDLLSFGDGAMQPPGRSVVLTADMNTPLSTRNYDWSRILAIEFDEPYDSIKSNPCYSQAGTNAAAGINSLLAQRAAELKSIAPLTRFWVNFTGTEVSWMMDSTCPAPFNQPYIDVISLDDYYKTFVPELKTYYDWLAAHPATPHQQLALFPGTFYRSGKDSQSVQASYLQGYFDYANTANQSCSLSRGGIGITGSFDGCRVWMVMGWLSGPWTDSRDNTLYLGELDSIGGPIGNAWRAEIALPVRPDLAHQVTRGQIFESIAPVLLHK